MNRERKEKILKGVMCNSTCTPPVQEEKNFTKSLDVDLARRDHVSARWCFLPFVDGTSKALESTGALNTAALSLDSYGWSFFPLLQRYVFLKCLHSCWIVSLEDFRSRLRLCWSGHCSQMQVSLAELQEGKYLTHISPWPILGGKCDLIIKPKLATTVLIGGSRLAS